MSPSDLPWWGWLLWALAFFVFGYLGALFYDLKYSSKSFETFWGIFLKILWFGFWILSALCAVVGVVSFIKWA
jgi:hypothetical protein